MRRDRPLNSAYRLSGINIHSMLFLPVALRRKGTQKRPYCNGRAAAVTI
jgi:hypothetical protein